MMNEKPGLNNQMSNSRMIDDSQFNSAAFLKELQEDLLEEDSESRYKDPYGNSVQGAGFDRIPDVDRISVRRHAPRAENRPTFDSKFMLKGLIEQAGHYNKTVDQRVMTDARIAFEEEQLRSGRVEDELEPFSGQNIPKRGRGDCFGKLRSVDHHDGSTGINNNNNSLYNNGFFKTKPRSFVTEKPLGNHRFELSDEDRRSLAFKSPGRFGSRLTTEQPPTARHHFNPETAYNGKITPDYRFNYNPQSGSTQSKPVLEPITASPFRLGQRYPKRPDNNPQLPSVPKHLNHNYYNIELYGATQEERIAQRIEKTVRQTESPIRRF